MLPLNGCVARWLSLEEVPLEEGVGPEQPIAFSHRIHAGEHEIPCQYCHNVADRSPTAGIPAVEVCMGCHALVKTDSEEVQKIHQYWEDGEPIPWVRIHNLADHAQFNHQPHIRAGVECQECHGPIEQMDVVYQYATLQMGWCINCHGQDREEEAMPHPSAPESEIGRRQPTGFYEQFYYTTYHDDRAPGTAEPATTRPARPGR